MLSMYKVYKEYNLDFPSRGSRIREMEGWRDGGGGATLTVQADKKKNPDIQYPWMMESASSTESQAGWMDKVEAGDKMARWVRMLFSKT